MLALSSSTEWRGWGSIQQLGKGGIEVIADKDLDPDSLSQVEEAFISAGLLWKPLLKLLGYVTSWTSAPVDPRHDLINHFDLDDPNLKLFLIALRDRASNSCWKSYVMLTKHQKETMFKTGAAISFVPFFPLLWHGYELAFVTKSINPHPGLVVFSILIVTNFCMRIPYLFITNKLVFRQSLAVLIVNVCILFLYLIALST